MKPSKGKTSRTRLSEVLTLTEANKLEAAELAKQIREHGGLVELWAKADRTPALSAEVFNLVRGEKLVTPEWVLERFFSYGDGGRPRGGRIWTRSRSKAYVKVSPV